MRSEEFDKKIIDAADHHQPAYSEQSWVEMKKLLDVHLPEKKDDRRRILFFLLLLLCLGGGIWLTASKPWKKQPLTTTTQDNTPGSVSPGQPPASAPVNNGEPGSSSKTANAVTTAKPSAVPVKDNNGQQPTDKAIPPVAGNNGLVVNKTNNTDKKNNSSFRLATPSKQNKVKPGVAINPGDGKEKKNARKNNIPPVPDMAVVNDNAVNKQTEPVPVSIQAINTPVENKKATETAAPVIVTDNNPVVSETKPVEAAPTTGVAAEPKAGPLAAAKAKTRSPLKKSIGFAFTLSAGPDISAVGLGNFGKVQPVFGAGINVSYGRHFSLSTGYYSVRKIYKAEAADYKFPTRPYHYSYLYEIDGNCKVIEIPVTLNWAFNEKKKGNWFVSAGVSSFIMKRETYDYMYKYPSGQVTKYTKQFGNKNQHIFSVVSLSGGYRYNLSKSVFVSAEPYVKIPLKGVGAGKLNLNSGGMLFTIGIKPF